MSERISLEANDSHSIVEAKRIVEEAEIAGVTLKLIGGLAIRFHCHGPHAVHLRAYQDIDFYGLSIQRKKIFSIFEKLGYYSNVKFNTLYGDSRLQFIGQEKNRDVDVFLDRFRMEHKLDFRERLNSDNLTISITDLLLTKLQIVKLTSKDEKDSIAILEDHETGSVDGKEILNVNYMAKLCSNDWGLYKTITDNLSRIVRLVNEGELMAVEKEKLLVKIKTIQDAIEIEEKNLRWKLRSMIGEKLKWYEDVEMGEGEMP